MTLFHDLIAHKGFADAELLKAIGQHPVASMDVPLRTLLHHVLVANRFWLLSIVGEPFNAGVETRVPDSFIELVAGFRATHAREKEWLASVADDALSRTLESPLILVVDVSFPMRCCKCACTRRDIALSARRCSAHSAGFHQRLISSSGVSIDQHPAGLDRVRSSTELHVHVVAFYVCLGIRGCIVRGSATLARHHVRGVPL